MGKISYYFIETCVGFIVFDKNGKIQLYDFFLMDTLNYAKLILDLYNQKSNDDLIKFGKSIDNLTSEDLIVENIDLLDGLKELTRKEVYHVSTAYGIFKEFRENLIENIRTIVPSITTSEMMERSKNLAEFISKKSVKESSENSDVHIRYINDTLDDTIKFINVYATRLREWYGIHFPELTDNLVSDAKLYASIVKEIGVKDKINAEKLHNLFNINIEYAEQIENRILDSMGANLTESQLKTIQNLSDKILILIEFRENLEFNLDDQLKLETPNLLKILGPQLTGKILSLAGGLKNLSRMPSSTIQILGAEKALFRSLKKSNESPKHGIIYTWPNIRGAKAWQRGKISRLLSGKISICAKVDYFKGNFVGDKIFNELEAKIEEITKKFPEPPERQIIDSKELARNKRKNISKSKYKKGIKNKRGLSYYDKA